MKSNIIVKAIKFATNAHRGQTRKNGNTPYINHCVQVAEIVEQYTNNRDLIAAAYLHDTIEDCNVNTEDLIVEFNHVVSALVHELTNVWTKKNFPLMKRRERKEKECERISRISYSAKLIKLADRLCNLRDFKNDDPDWGPNHYYYRESKDLLESLRGTNSDLERQIEEILA